MNSENPLRAMVPTQGAAGQQSSGMSERREFGAVQVSAAQSRAVGIAAQVKASVEARYVMALQRPRDMDQARQDILRECARPSFAANPSALYRKPIGKGVEGLGIRFVEMALAKMRNVLISTRVIDDDATAETLEIEVTDLESNVSWPMQIRVSKTVERSKPEDDGTYIAVRMNSYGKPVYTVTATDDDLLNKRAALVSKAMRTIGLRLIPGDIQDEAEALIRRTRENAAAADPDGERKRIVDAFGTIGVRAEDLRAFLGHDLGALSPAEVANLRAVFGAIRDGETTWKATVEAGAEQTTKPAAPTAAGTGKSPAPTSVDKSSGEIFGDGGSGGTAQSGAPTFAEVSAMLDKAATRDDADAAVAMIDAVSDAAHRAMLEKRAADVYAKLSKPAKGSKL